MPLPSPEPRTEPDWRQVWLIAGAADALARDGDHVTVDLPHLSLTAQNFRGTPRAFWNVCSHRAVQMRCAGRGRGLLRCPYHGWTYNAAGLPVGIPDNDRFFGLDEEARWSLALRPASLVLARGLILLRADAEAPEAAPALRDVMISEDWLVADRLVSTAHSGAAPYSVEATGDWTCVSQIWPTAGDREGTRHRLYHPDRRSVAEAPPDLAAPFVVLG